MHGMMMMVMKDEWPLAWR